MGKIKDPRQAQAIKVAPLANDVKNRTCSVCSKVLLKKVALVAHMRSHAAHNGTAHAKNSIHKKLRSSKNLKKELIKMYACHICSKKYTSEIYMKAHIRRFHNRKCSKCSKTFSSSFKMKEHLRICLGEVDSKETESKKTPELHPWGDKKNRTCPVCSKEFDRPNKMKRHWRFHHNKVIDMSTRTCPVCSKAFKYPWKMERHRRMHDRDDTAKRTCPFCNKTFSLVSRMTAHKKTQHVYPAKEPVGIRTCDICLKVFKSVAYKNNHVKRQHSNESVEKRTCLICSNVYSNSINLNYHIQRMHKERNLTPIQLLINHDDQNDPEEIKKANTLKEDDIEYRACNLCKEKSPTVLAFKQHFRTTHPGKFPFECKVCRKRYRYKISFHKHLKEAECQPELRKEYRKCAICYALLDNPKFLKGHMSTTHKGNQPFTCTHCEVSFVLLDEFEHHLLKVSTKCNNDEQKARVETYKNTIRAGIQEKRDRNVELEYRKCSVCYNVLAHEAALKTHMTKCHKGVTPFSCTQCARNFNSLKGYEDHMLKSWSECKYGKQKSRIKEYKNAIRKGKKMSKPESELKSKCVLYRKCPVCYKIFSKCSSFKEHMRTAHKGKKPFSCTHCGIKFVFLNNLEYHLHKESLACKNDEQLATLDTYKNTILAGVKETNNELEYRKCAVCYKEFVQKDGLSHHMVKCHAGENPFSCSGCMKNFECLKEFERHANDKTSDCKYGEHVSKLQEYKDTIIKGKYKFLIDKPEIYRKCAICYTTYVHTKSLKIHMLQHHKRAKPFVCTCKKGFNLYEDFENHVKESAKCDNDKQEAKLQMFKKAIGNGVHDKKNKKK